MCIISNEHYKFIIDSCRATSVAQYGFLPGNVVVRTNDKLLPIVAARRRVNHLLSTAVLTSLFIRVRVRTVKAWTMLPMGGNIVEVFSEKEKKETVSTVGGEG